MKNMRLPSFLMFYLKKQIIMIILIKQRDQNHQKNTTQTKHILQKVEIPKTHTYKHTHTLTHKPIDVRSILPTICNRINQFDNNGICFII